MTTQTESSQSIGQMSLDFGTCESAAFTTCQPPMQSWVASRAKTSATPGSGRGLRVSVAAYGLSSPALLASYDHATCSWRTSQRSLDGDLTPFLETWPRSGLMRSGTAYRLPPLVPLTAGTGCLSWPTPSAEQHNYQEDPAQWLERRERIKAKGINGNGMGMPLGIAVKLWPTPRHSDADRGGRGDLIQAVRGNPNSHYKMWPTPTAVDHKGANTRAPGKERPLCDDDLPTRVARESSGQLNPQWVELLMGFPPGWTELD